ncbi:helix-turn-helix domain-containing protein [Maribacter sp. 1_MG-2023]|uniref:winged helix-turn-helix transcriptional regulator n=1 Tax=Maribacter sp. 1_MG-2023 TaxID=3062677 RepID=UPI0026E22FB1|nr:helix-turn-helix domain-containing protein [Maribacter sp. 1_MG-2023]MDO6472442.1 helix-turn-helix domain-containing protein [Maribacter sp. 1_MG-2023]
MAKQNNDAQALDYCMDMIGGKWKPIILYHINKGTNRFNKLFAEIEGINRQMLSKQLKSLERSGILDRTLYGEIPPRVEYTLTPLGKSLLPVVQAMNRWGQKQLEKKIEIPEVQEAPKNQQLPLF